MVPEQEAHRVSISCEISEELQKANDTMRAVEELLRENGFATVASDLNWLYVDLLPILVRASPQTPVHHSPWVTAFLTRLLLHTPTATEDDLRVGLTAALAHDAGLAYSTRRKIAESEIAQEANRLGKDDPTVKALVEEAIQSRLEHAELSAKVIAASLQKFEKMRPGAYTPAQVYSIKQLVLQHDYLKIGTLQLQLGLEIDREYLYRADTSTLTWEHLLADLSWMLEGIETDRERDRRRGEQPKTPLEQLDWNLKCHRDIVALYRKACPDEFDTFGFLENLPIRSQQGLELYLELEREMRDRHTD